MSFIKPIILVFLIVFFIQVNSQTNTTIFGVRWFLGQNFRFHSPQPLQEQNAPCDLMLMFNSFVENLQIFNAQVQGKSYSCHMQYIRTNLTEYHHNNFNQLASNKGDIFQAWIYRCPITFDQKNFLKTSDFVNYSIVTENEILFEGELRSPIYDTNQTELVVLGDWGLLTNYSKLYSKIVSIEDCLIDSISLNMQIRLILLLGDLAYDLQGQTYIRYLSNLEKYSSQIVLMFTPGNHQTLHYDIYELVKQSFYSPFWARFHGYYDLTAIGKYAFLAYNPETLFLWMRSNKSNISMYEWSPLEKEYGDYYNLFQQQLTETTKKILQNNYTVFVYSHYPIYASEDDEHEDGPRYRKLQSSYLDTFNQIGMDMYFSGHLHYYERTKMICDNGSFSAEKNGIFEKSDKDACSIYVIEGAAGNNYYVQTQNHFPLKDFSEKLVEKTGYGLLTLNHEHEDKSVTYSFQHLSTKLNCTSADTFMVRSKRREKVDEQSQKIMGQTIEIKKEQNIVWLNWWWAAILGVLAIGVLLKKKFYRRGVVHEEENINLHSHENIIELAENEGV